MNRIRELRLENNMTMRRAAEVLGMPYTTYVNYEKGLREPNSEVLIKIANYYHVTVDFLLGNVSDPFYRLDNEAILADINSYEENKKAPAESGKRSRSNDILDEVDVAFYGDYKELSEDDKETLRAMARVMKERQARKNQEK